ncbi:fumarylacetoacetate hydrolase family protein [Pandoraea norimbergensis]|uniref:5-oxopent-3-ene-1,2,5-tricarboxylate decarboxylase n=1 Tax=Pandoraea norimbergensis TaxID=93219 RepID=A0ABM5WM24_9BURK|nr:fumarylacetoacetate hydrolase family protein [Pandoraea norimbergensis]ALS61582.1 5-oxopent-3-ene-1,2,5-tricarboxylate decarboxylase [Pandoraea norimbergensis]
MTWFGIATYESLAPGAGADRRTALVQHGRLYDLEAVLRHTGAGNDDGVLAAQNLTALLSDWYVHGETVMAAVRQALDAGVVNKVSALETSQYRLCVPYQPGRIFATASNFYEHAAEMGTKLAPRSESSPYMFMKAETSVTATNTDVVLPPNAERVDWEVELAVVIGRPGRHVPVEQAHEWIAGYTVINDVSARDLNRRTDYPFTHDWFRGKSFDTFAPLGPWFVPRDVIRDPQNLRMTLSVNGESMQDDTTAGMIFNIAEQIAYLSGILTLKPGDLIATGTPTGVGMGRGVYLKAGDVMVAGIEGIGAIENRVVAQRK